MNDDEREILRRTVARFAAEQLAPSLEAMDHNRSEPLSTELLDGMRQLGLFDLARGLEDGDDIAALCTALDALARTSASIATLVLAHSYALDLVERAGAMLDPSAAAEPLWAFPIYQEPAAPSSRMRCRAKGGRLRLDGICELVVNAPVADMLLLPVVGDEPNELSLVAVLSDAVSIGEPLLTLGMRDCPTADVTAEKLVIDSQWQIAATTQTTDLLAATARRFRGPAAAISSGVLASSLETATAYARERYQGGSAIIEHQQVRAMLGGMLADYALCRELTERLATPRGQADVALESLFVRAKRRAALASCDGVQLLGGYGYMQDYGQEGCMRDAKQAQCLLGRCDALNQQVVSSWLETGGQL